MKKVSKGLYCGLFRAGNLLSAE